MSPIISSEISVWAWWKKILFRFFFIYLVLQATPWLFSVLPIIRSLLKYYNELIDWAVKICNSKLFHVKSVLVPMISDIDSSWAWAQQWLFLCTALTGCILWSLLDRRRKNYIELNYWLTLFTRYYIAIIAFAYGFQKVFALQIPYPNRSMMATPIGDLLPMRLYWVSIGYSPTYQIFAGLVEVLTGILLLYRKTITLGSLLGVAVFSNLMIINFSYDIPAKIICMNLVVFCLLLAANEYKRIVNFFILNKPAPVSGIYDFYYTEKWMLITRVILKATILTVFVLNFYGQWRKYKIKTSKSKVNPIKSGIYNVVVYAVNNDTILPLITDSMRWQNVIFEKDGQGSIKTADTTFRQLYNRGYFAFKTDTVDHIINFKKGKQDSLMFNGTILSLHYQIPDSNTIQLWGKRKNDSLYILLKKSTMHFQLDEKQFHWLTDYPR